MWNNFVNKKWMLINNDSVNINAVVWGFYEKNSTDFWMEVKRANQV